MKFPAAAGRALPRRQPTVAASEDPGNRWFPASAGHSASRQPAAKAESEFDIRPSRGGPAVGWLPAGRGAEAAAFLLL